MTLRNCPLCGKNHMRHFEEGPARRDEFGEMWFTEKTEKFIECLTCGHTASGWEEGEAEEEWNWGEVAEWERAWWNVAQTRRRILNDYTPSEEK